MTFSVLQWNARGLRGHQDQLKNYLYNKPNPPDVVCIQETFLTDNAQVPIITGFNLIRKDCDFNEKGGLAIYIKMGLNYDVMDLGPIVNYEMQGIEIATVKGHLKIFNVYLSGSQSINKPDLLKKFPDKRTLIVGDFNGHNKVWGCTYTNERGKIIDEIITEKNLVILNTGQATYISPIKSDINSVIDLGLSTIDIALQMKHIVSNATMGSDHLASTIIIDEEIIIENNASMQLWKLEKANWRDYKEASNNTLTEEILDKEDIDVTYNNIVDCITDMANNSIPKKNLNKKKKTKELNDYMEFKKQESITKAILKTEAKNSWQEYCNGLTDQTKLGTVWNWSRRMNGVVNDTSIPILKKDGEVAENNLNKANMLAKTYASTSSSQNYNKKFLDYIKVNNFENNPDKIVNGNNK